MWLSFMLRVHPHIWRLGALVVSDARPCVSWAGVRLRRVEPLDDSLESVFGYLVEK